MRIIVSSEDIARYLIAHLNEGRYGSAQILSAAGIDELHRPAVEANAMGLSFDHYGMGWFIEQTGQAKIVSHPGTLPDFFAYMAIVPEQKKGMVLLVNANQLMMDLAQWEFGAGVAKLLGGERSVPKRSGAIIPWALRSCLSSRSCRSLASPPRLEDYTAGKRILAAIQAVQESGGAISCLRWSPTCWFPCPFLDCCGPIRSM